MYWLLGLNFNVEEWDAKGQTYETLAICRTLAFARAVFEVAIAEKPAGHLSQIREKWLFENVKGFDTAAARAGCPVCSAGLRVVLVLAWLQFSQCSFRFSDATFLLGGAPFFFVGYLVRCGG